MPGTVCCMADHTNDPAPVGEQELQIARENLDAYLELAWEIFEEMRAQVREGLTDTGESSTIQERSNG